MHDVWVCSPCSSNQLTFNTLRLSEALATATTTTGTREQCAAESSDDGTDDETLFVCPHCPDRKFKTKAGLNGHMGAHNRKRKGTGRTKLCHKKKGRKGNNTQAVRHSLKDGGALRLEGRNTGARKEMKLLKKSLKRKAEQLDATRMKMQVRNKVVLSRLELNLHLFLNHVSICSK